MANWRCSSSPRFRIETEFGRRAGAPSRNDAEGLFPITSLRLRVGRKRFSDAWSTEVVVAQFELQTIPDHEGGDLPPVVFDLVADGTTAGGEYDLGRCHVVRDLKTAVRVGRGPPLGGRHGLPHNVKIVLQDPGGREAAIHLRHGKRGKIRRACNGPHPLEACLGAGVYSIPARWSRSSRFAASSRASRTRSPPRCTKSERTAHVSGTRAEPARRPQDGAPAEDSPAPGPMRRGGGRGGAAFRVAGPTAGDLGAASSGGAGGRRAPRRPFAARRFFRVRKIPNMLVRWGPLAFGLLRLLGAAVKGRDRTTRSARELARHRR